MGFALAFIALLTEAVAGYPAKIEAKIGHPVGWMSALLRRADAAWKDLSLSPQRLRLRGILALATALLITASLVLLIDRAADLVLPALVALVAKGLLAGTLIAGRSLDERVSAVADALETRGLEAGRAALQRLAPRETRTLDEAGVARAAIEDLARGFAEGVVAPLLWLSAAGLPGGALYKLIGAAGSEPAPSGHAAAENAAYGWAASLLEDVASWPSARLAAVWLAAAARVMPEADWRQAALSAVRDGPRHRNLNAGWPEAAMAGALDLALGGPAVAGGRRIDNAWMGTGRRALTSADIHLALRLYRIAYVLQAATIAILALIALLVF